MNLKMAEVAATFRAAGFADVRTILASGNVALTAAFDAEAVRATAETALQRQFGYDARVLVYDFAVLRSVVEGYPFPPGAEGRNSYVTFVSDPAVLDELAALAAGAGPDEQIASGDRVLYWQVPISTTAHSTIGKTMGRRRYASSTTTRNLRTLGKVLHE